MKEIRVVIVEDHATTRIGLRVELSEQPDIDVVDVAGTVEEAIRKCNDVRPDVILLDLHLPDSNGPKSLINTFVPLARVVVFSAEGSKAIIKKIMELGAAGFVSKSDSTAQLLDAIRAAAELGRPSGKTAPVTVCESPVEAEDPHIGKIVDERFKVLETLGLGSYSVVYKAHDLLNGGVVALKILHPHLALVREAAQRFRREAEACSMLNHPNIAAVYGYGLTATGQPYLAMEYVNGISLDAELTRCGRLPPARVISIVRQICAGLDHAHNAGIVHRDVKPANVHLGRDDLVKLLDFGLVKVVSGDQAGIASLTTEGATIGTPCYMSPEQCRGMELDGRSDVYAVGCILYELLAGSRMFDGNTIVEVMLKHINEKPDMDRLVTANVPPGVIAVVDKALQKDLRNRYNSARELAFNLGQAAESCESKKMSLFKLWS